MFGKLGFFENKNSHIKEKPKEKLKITKNIKKFQKKKIVISSRVDTNLSGSKFRLINEFFYTNSSDTSLSHFKKNTDDFKIYHEGFQNQINKWPTSPANFIIKLLEQNKKFHHKVICDLGCGEGFIYEYFLNKKHIKENEKGEILSKNYLFQKFLNFDLVSLKPYIQIADIKKLPLKNESIGVSIFCLALMGLNYLEFLIESFRCLEINGFLIIAEVVSRIPNLELFCELIKKIGFHLEDKYEPNNYFLILVFKKISVKHIEKKSKDNNFFNKISADLNIHTQIKDYMDASKLLLKPCIYKKR